MEIVVIIIPIYKEKLNDNELISLNQCLKILSRHPILYVGPNSLNVDYYKNIMRSFNAPFNIEYFGETWFKDINGYNRLLLTREFYVRFSSYQYMLIYQLDAYVFKDTLLEWCSLGYDFIGAPSVGHYKDDVFSYNLVVGNGGFSLRKIKTYVEAFDYKKNLLSIREILKQHAVFKKVWTRIPLLILMIFGFRNKLSYKAKKWKYPEDDFWSKYLIKTSYPLTKPSAEEALEFAFERFPSNLFAITKKLPFGCHGWYRYEYEKFWKNYIPKDKTTEK